MALEGWKVICVVNYNYSLSKSCRIQGHLTAFREWKIKKVKPYSCLLWSSELNKNKTREHSRIDDSAFYSTVLVITCLTQHCIKRHIYSLLIINISVLIEGEKTKWGTCRRSKDSWWANSSRDLQGATPQEVLEDPVFTQKGTVPSFVEILSSLVYITIIKAINWVICALSVTACCQNKGSCRSSRKVLHMAWNP